MKISARIESRQHYHATEVQTNGSVKTIQLPVKPSGYGSAVNGGELLLLSLATCFCNDIYREAEARGIPVSGVTVECDGEFGAPGEPGVNFKYRAEVNADASPAQVEELVRITDQVAEVHNTLRKGLAVILER